MGKGMHCSLERYHSWHPAVHTDLPAEVNASNVAHLASPTPLVARNQLYKFALEEPGMKSKGFSEQELGSTRDFA